MIKFDKSQSQYSICDKWNRPSPSAVPAPAPAAAVHHSYQSYDNLPDGYDGIPIKKKNKISSARSSITNVKLDVPYTSLS